MCLAVPGKVVSVEEPDTMLRIAKVDFGGVTRPVSLACVPAAQPGDYVIVHVGLALSVIDETEARRVFEEIEQMGEIESIGEIEQFLSDASLPKGGPESP